eukprot:c39863_g1_i1 orf=1-288(-)
MGSELDRNKEKEDQRKHYHHHTTWWHAWKAQKTRLDCQYAAQLARIPCIHERERERISHAEYQQFILVNNNCSFVFIRELLTILKGILTPSALQPS